MVVWACHRPPYQLTLRVSPDNPQLARSVNPRRLLRRCAYAMAGLLSLFLLPFCAGALWQAIASHRDLRQNPSPGRLVDVGGYRMHVNSAGTGSPIVILDSGLSDSSLSWVKVQPEVARFVRVVSYDRAGLGWSDPSPRPRNSRVFAEELHTLLHNAGIPAPFVLVGHSMGGYDVRMFASLFRSEVAGMVLVDASHPDVYALSPGKRRTFALWRSYLITRQRQIRFGVARLRGWCDEGAPQPALRTVECRSSRYEEALAELDSKLQMLLVFFRAVVPPRERQDEGVVALEFDLFSDTKVSLETTTILSCVGMIARGSGDLPVNC